MYKQITLFIILLLINLSYAKKPTKIEYTAYIHGIPAGKTVVIINNNKIEVKGKTKGLINIFYKYEFYFLYDHGKMKLIEKEGKKKKVYEGEKINKKKPWLPLIVSFFKEDKEYFKKLNGKTVKIGEKLIKIYIIETRNEDIFVFKPQNSKTKKVAFYVKKDSVYPYKIEIIGKKEIILQKK
ncbi:MAG: hypothetical protein GXO22_07950 [Aquificae bacterium]|nr:hypothetical protein [Aquificota bacterium]